MKKVISPLFAILLVGCNLPKPESSLSIIDLINPLSVCDLKISDYADEITYIQFDTAILLKGYTTPQYMDGYFFIKTSREGILRYNLHGKFLNRIGGIGQGPGEYNGMLSFLSLDPDKQEVHVYDFPNKILIYTPDGEFIRSVNLDERNGYERLSENGFYRMGNTWFFPYVVSADQETLMWETFDDNGKLLSTKSACNLNFGDYNYSHASIPMNNMYQKTVLYQNCYNDTVFRISLDGIEPAFLWSKGGLVHTPETESLQQKSIRTVSVFETDRYLFIIWMLNYNSGTSNEQHCSVYDKTNKTVVDSKNLFIDDINGGFFNLITNYFEIDGREYLGTIVNEEKLREKLYETNTSESRALAETIDEDANPILTLIRLKK